MLEKTILLPSAWKGGDLHEEDWIIDLPDPLVEELTNAAKLLYGRGLSFKQTNAGDYRLESWQSVLNEIRERIEGGLGFTLLRGLPAENGLDLARLYLWGLGCHLGFPEPQDAVGNLMHDVKDTGNDLSDSDIRLYQTNLALSYHNDGADAFMLMCFRAAKVEVKQNWSALCQYSIPSLNVAPTWRVSFSSPSILMHGDSNFLIAHPSRRYPCLFTTVDT